MKDFYLKSHIGGRNITLRTYKGGMTLFIEPKNERDNCGYATSVIVDGEQFKQIQKSIKEENKNHIKHRKLKCKAVCKCRRKLKFNKKNYKWEHSKKWTKTYREQ